jgi:DNA-binding CsgD family transcriptional regulator/predicted transcriptional regulator
MVAQPDSLEGIGISGLEESVYRQLLRHPGASVPEISQRLGAGQHAVRTALAGLERRTMIGRAAGPRARYIAVAPDVAFEALISRRLADLDQVRAAAQRLMTDFYEGLKAQPPGLIEIVTGTEAVHKRFEQLQRGARHLVQVLDTPPYAGPGGTPNQVEFEALARGVVYRGIYDKTALDAAPGTINAIARYVAAGEQARFLPRVPFKLATFDHEFACAPITIAQTDVARFMVVRACSLLDALLYIFDTLWERATPMTFGQPETPGDKPPYDSRLLNLLAAGMTDEAIARHLDWSHRTTRRRIAALLTTLGAESRFQAGLRAARNGWLLPAIPAGRPGPHRP